MIETAKECVPAPAIFETAETPRENASRVRLATHGALGKTIE
jgi:hypothetical protein